MNASIHALPHASHRPLPLQFLDLADKDPHKPIFHWVNDQGQDSHRLTALECKQKALRIAQALFSEASLRPGDAVVLVYLPGPDFFLANLACLLSGLVAVPAYPSNLRNPAKFLGQIHALAADCQATCILTQNKIRRIARLGRLLSWNASNKWIATDVVPDSTREAKVYLPRPEDRVLIQYTSGSTSSPKGVVLNHRNISHQLAFNNENLDYSENSRGVCWVPQYHDLGLISFIYACLSGVAPLWMFSPIDFLKSPSLWFEVMHRVRATHTAAPNFAYALSLRKTTVEQRRSWDLSSLKVLMSAAEPIRKPVMDDFFAAFEASRLDRKSFLPAYGLAEHSVGVSMGRERSLKLDRRLLLERGVVVEPRHSKDELELMSCGRPGADMVVRIVDPESRRIHTSDTVGEIWVSSDSKSLMYINKPEETRALLHAQVEPQDGEAYLRTGDLGFLHEGELYVCGRLKDLIIIRGRNYYPQDIEFTSESAHPSLRAGCSVVFSTVIEGEERLVVVQEVRAEFLRGLDPKEVISAIRSAILKEHQLHVHEVALAKPKTIPKTSSGKVRRRVAKEQHETGRLQLIQASVAEASPAAEPELDPEAWREALENAPNAVVGRHLMLSYLREGLARSTGLSASELEPHTPLAATGLDSLRAVELRSTLESDLRISCPLEDLFEETTLAKLADRLYARIQDPEQAPEQVEIDWPEEAELDPSIGFRPRSPETANRQAVFLTGATGFLGGYLLAEILHHTRDTVFCLVQDKAGRAPEDRLKENLTRVGIAYPAVRHRLVVVRGDLTQRRFGLAEQEYDRLNQSIRAVYHCAAQPNWVLPYKSLRGANVTGTQEALRLAAEAGSVPMHFISTMAVFPLKQRGVFEEEVSFAPETMETGYGQSKWVAEQLCFRARERGVPVFVYRMDFIVAPLESGMIDRGHFLPRLLQTIMQLKVMPEETVNMDIIPVDQLARMIRVLSERTTDEGMNFHLVNPRPLTSDMLAENLRDFGYDVERVPYDHFKDRVLSDKTTALHALSPFLSKYESEDLREYEVSVENTLAGLGSDAAKLFAAIASPSSLVSDLLAFLTPVVVGIRGPLEPHRWARSLARLDAQAPRDPVEPPVDLRHLHPEARQAKLREFAELATIRPEEHEAVVRRRPYQLFNTSNDVHVLLLRSHRTTSDWSIRALLGQLSLAYHLEASPFPNPNAAPAPSWEEQEGFWKRQLSTPLPMCNLPFSDSSLGERGSEVHTLTVSEPLRKGLDTLARSTGTSLNAILLTAFNTLLFRYTARSEQVVRVSAFREGLECLPRTLFLRTGLDGEESFAALLQRVASSEAEAKRNLDFDPGQLVAPDNLPLVFSFQSTRGHREIQFDLTPRKTLAPSFDLALAAEDTHDQLRLSFEFQRRCGATWEFDAFFASYLSLLAAAAENPNLAIKRLPLLTEAERREQLHRGGLFETSQPSFRSFCARFDQQVEASPEATAVRFAGASMSYAELHARSNQWAHYLKSLGVAENDLVGICVERSLEMLVGLIGILKAGGAYLPLSPSDPNERSAFMLQDSKVRFLLTQSKLEPRFSRADLQTLCLDLDRDQDPSRAFPTHSPPSVARADSTAYAIYTSGTTGRPKAALVAHQSLDNYLDWCLKTYAFERGCGTLVHSSFAFDGTITGLFPPLLVGRSVTFVGEEDPLEEMARLLRTEGGYSVIKITPAHLSLLAQQLDADQAKRACKTFVIGGDALHKSHVEFWQRHAPNTVLINEYGPTEATVGCMNHRVTARDDRDRVPIGTPIQNAQVLVLDDQLEPVPLGLPGEIYIGGLGLAQGYLKNLTLTQEKFITNPFAAGRLYKTGDVARHIPHGGLEFLGRSDRQLKIRGWRIELGEIEAVLSGCAGVKEAVVVPTGDTAETRSLTCFLVAPLGLDLGALKRELSNALPAYMVPSRFVLVEAFALTGNGKIDREALLRHAATPIANDSEPLTPMESALKTLWCRILDLSTVDVTASFFEQGGNSLLAMTLVAEIQKTFGMRLALKSLRLAPTIRQLAARMEEGPSEEKPLRQEPPARVEAKVAPLVDRRDLEFVLFEQMGLSGEQKEDAIALISAAEQIAREKILPTRTAGDRQGCTFVEGRVITPEGYRELYDLLRRDQWINLDRVDGAGLGVPATVQVALNEFFNSANHSFMLYLFATRIVSKIISRYGSELHKKLYLEPLSSGEFSGAGLLSEPTAGSDLSLVRTRATPLEDGIYSLSGQKSYVTPGEHDFTENKVYLALARVLDAHGADSGELALFIVPKIWIDPHGKEVESNHVVCTGIEEKLGLHGQPVCSLSLGDEGLCRGYLLRPLDKELIGYIGSIERTGIGGHALGDASAAFLHALGYARERVQGTAASHPGAHVPIIQHPNVRRQLLTMKALIGGMRSLIYYQAAGQGEEDEEARRYYRELLVPIVKAHVSDRAFEVSSRALQVMGAAGYTKSHPIEQFLRDSRANLISGGTNGIQAIHLIQHLSRRDADSFGRLKSAIAGHIHEADRVERLRHLAQRVQQALARLSELVGFIRSAAERGDTDTLLDVATPTLEALGDTVLAWMHLWRSTVAVRALKDLGKDIAQEDLQSLVASSSEAAFYVGKISAAEFFIEELLPLAEEKMRTLLRKETRVSHVPVDVF